jgi:lysophospholipase L1-like esterase
MNVRVLLTLVAATSGCALANHADEEPGTYLALGDSVAFGFNPLLDLRTHTVTGYPELVAGDRGLTITNLSCPGEATGGFVSPTGADNHCRENRQMYPLHADYDGTQLDAAIDYLANHPETQLVTIDIGANDVFLLDHICNRDLTCILTNFVATIDAYNKNLDTILEKVRHAYAGPLVGLTIYNPYPTDRTAQYAIEQIDSALTAKLQYHGGIVADGLNSFATAGVGDPCAAGLLIKLPDGTCDVHPTASGAKVLADAIDAALAAQ